MEKSRSHSRSSSCLGCGLIGLAGLVLIGLWGVVAARIPAVNIPAHVMPSPNAFDFYVQAGNAIVGDTQIGDAISTMPSTPYPLVQKEALVQQNLGAISTLHQGFAYPYVNPSTRGTDTSFLYLAKFRSIARLMALRGLVREERGDWSGAADSYLDAVRIGEDIPHGSPIIGYLVGIACQAIGRRLVWSTVEHLNVAQSRAAAARLESIMAGHFSYADTLQEEKWDGQSALLEMFQDPKKLGALFGSSDLSSEDPEEGHGSAFLQSISRDVYIKFNKSRILNDYTNWMDKSAQIARKSYGLHLPPPAVPKDPINSLMLPIFTASRLQGVNSETQNGLLLVTLALHAYHVEHGRYPSALSELAPTYLKKLPDDPFAVEGTFKYLLDSGNYLLYSVGPDGHDDSGTPIDDPANALQSNPNARYRANFNSVGDVVAGKNLY